LLRAGGTTFRKLPPPLPPAVEAIPSGDKNNNDSCLENVRGAWGWLSSLCRSPSEDERSLKKRKGIGGGVVEAEK
jgi:hypothetical protein